MTTSVALSPVAILQFFDNTGKPCVGGSLLTQSGGVNYATYSEPTGTTALPNPIPLNSRGEISTAAGASSELFLQTGVAYTFTLKDKDGNQLWSVGNITTGSGNTAVSFPTASGSANAQIVTNPVPISLGTGTIQWFLPVAANTGATTLNVDNSGAKNVFYLTKALVGGELQIGVPAQVIYDGTQWNLMQSAKGPAADYYLDTGSVNALAITANIAQTTAASLSGAIFKVKAANTNTAGLSTFNPNSINAFTIYLADGTTQAPPGSIISGNVYVIMINVSGAGCCLLNPSRVTGSFTITLTGMTGTVTGTVNYAINPDGKTVYVWATAAITGTSNASTMTGTGVPAILTTSSSQRVPWSIEDSGALSTGYPILVTGTGTTWTFAQNLAQTGGFATSLVKGILAFQTSFTL